MYFSLLSFATYVGLFTSELASSLDAALSFYVVITTQQGMIITRRNISQQSQWTRHVKIIVCGVV